MGKRIAGVCYIKVGAEQLPLAGNWTVSPSPTQREGIAGQDGVHGYKEMPRVPFISGDAQTTGALSIETLDKITDATVTAELANGKVYVLREAWTASAHEVNSQEGQVAVRFEGISCDEL